MNFIHKTAILALIAINLQAQMKDFIREVHKYQLEVACTTPVLDLRVNQEYHYTGINMLFDLYGTKRTVFELITVGFGGEYLQKIGLTKPHIDAIIDARERPAKEKLVKLGLRGIEMEVFDCAESELEEMHSLLSFVQKYTILKMREATSNIPLQQEEAKEPDPNISGFISHEIVNENPDFISEKAPVSNIINTNLPTPNKNLIKKADDYKEKIYSSTPILNLRENPEYDHAKIPAVSGIAMLFGKYGSQLTIFQLLTMDYVGVRNFIDSKEFLRKHIGLTETHIDAIIDAQTNPTKEKFIALGLTEFEIEILNSAESELDGIYGLLSLPQKDTIRSIQKAASGMGKSLE